ncbi:hypothetical protein BC628DRAFT_984745 [Trametes gibbosa]|nr:hypothetical protein BC628DRAFT_984745 [Trametes gibbosa]
MTMNWCVVPSPFMTVCVRHSVQSLARRVSLLLRYFSTIIVHGIHPSVSYLSPYLRTLGLLLRICSRYRSHILSMLSSLVSHSIGPCALTVPRSYNVRHLVYLGCKVAHILEIYAQADVSYSSVLPRRDPRDVLRPHPAHFRPANICMSFFNQCGI